MRAGLGTIATQNASSVSVGSLTSDTINTISLAEDGGDIQLYFDVTTSLVIGAGSDLDMDGGGPGVVIHFGNVGGDVLYSGGALGTPSSGTLTNCTGLTSVLVADTTDSTCYVSLFESSTGELGPKTDAGITYNATSGTLTLGGGLAASGNITGSSVIVGISGTLQFTGSAANQKIGFVDNLTVSDRTALFSFPDANVTYTFPSATATLAQLGANMFTGIQSSATAIATPSALSATGYNIYASTVSGLSLGGFGTTNDVTLRNRAGTVCLGVGPNTTAINMVGAVIRLCVSWE